MHRSPLARRIATTALIALCIAGCGDRSPAHRDQDEYVDDVAAFTKSSADQVRARVKQGAVPLKEEWEAWEKQGPMTPERIKAFYKQTTNYIYELGHWHLWDSKKRKSDLALVEDMRSKTPKN